METPIRLKSPSNIVYLTMVPFILFTFLILVIRREDVQLYLTFMLAVYGVIYSAYVGGSWWGLYTMRNRSEATIESMLMPMLYCLAPVLLGWVALVVHSPIFSLVFLAIIQAVQLFIFFKLRRGDIFPSQLLPIKIHPFMVSVPCLILSALFYLFNQ
jgi:hypothetical protein